MFSLIHKWHKKIGIVTALFVVILVISGIAINHSHTLKLNDKYIKSDWLLNLYQIKPDKDPIGFKINDEWISQVGNRVYYNNEEILKDIDQLIGVVVIGEVLIVAVDHQLTLLTFSGEIIEHLTGTDGVPAGMRKLGLTEANDVVIRAAHGFYQVNIDQLEWNEFDHLDASWSKDDPLPLKTEQALLEQYRGTGLSFERVLLDLHSGRILGEWGVFLVDFAALLFLVLALSGSWMWWVRK